MSHEHALTGCRSEPLGSYLKALGVLRLVAEQADRDAAGRWTGDAFVLDTSLRLDDLVAFFLDCYVPTPVVSPWNSSSGFGKEGVRELQVIEASEEPRLEPYRRAIATSRRLLAKAERLGWDLKRDKALLVAACRSELPDEALCWLDAAVVLTGDGGEIAYPPLLGTGGNDGRLEFSRNFHRHLIQALGLGGKHRETAREPRAGWLKDALFGSSTEPALRGSPGQFDPGSAGGVNSSALGRAETVVNPWDFVLLIEGSTLFASGISRRLGLGARGRAAMPFMVNASPVGFASAAKETSRGELWAPVWQEPALLPEVVRFFAEGRVEWAGRRAASGLDVVKAAASLGVDRGIAAFTRHVFLERFGLSTIAVVAGQTSVVSRPEVAPLGELDAWVDRVRRVSDPPASVALALRSLDQASYDLAHEGGSRRLLWVLSAAARLERAIARSGSFRNKATNRLDPIWNLKAASWIPPLLVDGSGPEMRLAIALSSCRDVDERGRTCAALAWLLRPVAVMDGKLRYAEPSAVPPLGTRPLAEVLAAAHVRRLFEVEARARRGEVADEAVGIATSYSRCQAAPLPGVTLFARNEIRAELFADALSGLLLLDWTWPWHGELLTGEPRTPEPALAVLGPFFARALAGRSRLLPEASWPTELAHDRTANVLAAALRRLRIAGVHAMPLDGRRVAATAPAGRQLAAALLCPLSSCAGAALLQEIAPPELDADKTEEEVHAQA